MDTAHIEPIPHDTYIALIKNSVGSNLFRTSFVSVDGKKKDILEDGNISCAFFVSCILKILDFCDEVHSTINGTVNDLIKNEWEQIQHPKIGSVLVWEEMLHQSGRIREHIGFYVGRQKAISHSDNSKSPTIHHWTFGRKNKKPVRRVTAIYWNRKLNGRNCVFVS